MRGAAKARDAAPGPAEAELRAYLRAHRGRLPQVLRLSAYWGAAAFVAYMAVIAVLAWYVPELAWVLAGFFVLVVVGGREPAMLLAFQELGEGALPWLALVAVLGDIAIVLLGVPFLALGFERLRAVRGFRGFLLGVERRALENHRFVQRWGPPALLGFVAIPAWGTGPLVAGAIGLLARIRPSRLLLLLVFAVCIVNIAWAALIAQAHAAIPIGGAWQFLPFGVLAVVFVVAGWASWRGTYAQEVLLRLEDPARVPAVHLAGLERLGVRHKAGLLRVDRRRLEAALGVPPSHPERCRVMAELLLLPSMEPAAVFAVARVGVHSIQDLAVAPPELVAAALRERLGTSAGSSHGRERTAAWTAEARAFMAGDPIEPRP